MHRSRALGVVALGIALSPSLASAQGTPAISPPAASTGATPRTAARRAPARAHSGAGAVATLPGFELLPDGGSRFFVELTQTVVVEEKKSPGLITYVLKGAHITKRNNANALVTVHFNTPVTRARLLSSGRDLHFVVDLRQNAVPTWKLTPAKEGGAILQVDFPKGDYLPAAGEPLPSDSPSSTRGAGAGAAERGSKGSATNPAPPASKKPAPRSPSGPKPEP